jgi:RNA polymerase I-specific transcription initiation factor RRN3
MYKMIITAFNSVILTTHRSKFVQFVILFLCGLDYDSKDHEKKKDDEEVVQAADQSMLSREFAAKLIDLVLDPFRPSINRQSAACYLASFVSRSTSVCPGTACEAVSAILRFAEAYMDTYHTEALARNARRGAGMDFGTGNQTSKVALHSIFYTACQSAFYIMCFRGRECIEYYQKAVEYYAHLDHENDDEDHILLYPDPKLIDISMQRWTRLVSHHLHPLMHCLESVRGEFLLLSDRFDLIEGSVLERLIIKDRKMASSPKKGQMVKKANSIRTAATQEKRRMNGGVGGLGRGSNPLDSFFPFDPYLLRRSYSFVEPYYRHWIGSLYDDSLKNESECEEASNLVDDEVSIGDDDDISSDDLDDEEDDNDHSIEDTTECTAMSLTSTTCFIPENDDSSDSDITANDLAVKKETWMRELKRSRALSIEDCW